MTSPMDFLNPVAAWDTHLVCLTQAPVQRTLKTPELPNVIVQERRAPVCCDGAWLNTGAHLMSHDSLRLLASSRKRYDGSDLVYSEGSLWLWKNEQNDWSKAWRRFGHVHIHVPTDANGKRLHLA